MVFRTRHSIALAVASLAAGMIAAFPGCSSQGEGERCSVLSDNNGNDDCQDGLICVAAAQLNGAGNTTDRCCPPDRTTATTVACQLPSGGGIDAAPPPVDANVDSPSAEGGDSAAADAGTDAGAGADGAADAAADGPEDAPADG
jgi:hypothetical protein